ncbi:tetratricopeptide repeat protein [Terracidiphilus gabretensis]|uniref:tetratricopeptide repeat protein n=1 Tax=Terracidiphilus gabretensis TaxID=1577687 RepID=UPI00071BEBDB|nr:tetratricopeptide repeat protein [Terracidiphilus gabretensis]
MRSVLPFVLTPALCAAAGVPAQQSVPQDDPKAQMDRAIADYRSGDLDHARRELSEILASHPQDVRAAALLGYADIKLQRDAEAYETLAPLEKGNENNLDLEYVLGYAMIRTGKTGEGVQRMETVARARGAADAWMIAGTMRFERRQFHEAQANAEEAIKINPNYPGAQTLKGKCLYASGNRYAAAEAFQAALRSEPNDFDANLYLGVLYSERGDQASARPLLELALTLRPGWPLARLELARVYKSEGNNAGAIQLLESLTKSDPEWMEPHIILSTIYFIMNRPEDGKRERAIVQQLEEKQRVR